MSIESFGSGRIDNPEEARKAALAEKPLRDIAREEDIKPEEKEILEVWDKMIKQFEVGENCSPTILANEFYSRYNEQEFKKLPQWKQDYITKNKRIYEKYKIFYIFQCFTILLTAD